MPPTRGRSSRRMSRNHAMYPVTVPSSTPPELRIQLIRGPRDAPARGPAARWRSRPGPAAVVALRASAFRRCGRRTPRHHRARSGPDDPVGDASEEEALESAPAMGAHDDKVGAFPLDGLHDLVARGAGNDASERGDALPATLGRALLQRLPGPVPAAPRRYAPTPVPRSVPRGTGAPPRRRGAAPARHRARGRAARRGPGPARHTPRSRLGGRSSSRLLLPAERLQRQCHERRALDQPARTPTRGPGWGADATPGRPHHA